jgi:hypothetical protein
MDGNKAVVGVHLSDDFGRSSGSVYVFVPEPSGILTIFGLGLMMTYARPMRSSSK